MEAFCKCFAPVVPAQVPAQATSASSSNAAETDEAAETERVYLAMQSKSTEQPLEAARGSAKAGSILSSVAEDTAETGEADEDRLPSLDDIQHLKQPETILRTLGIVTDADNEAAAALDRNAFAIECCKQLRVLCRDHKHRQRCDQLGTARIICAALTAMPADHVLNLQGLAAIVNLCSGEVHPPRNTAIHAGAVRVAHAAVKRFPERIEIGEMACLLVQNLTYGEDSDAIPRRKKAIEHGAIELAIGVMLAHDQAPGVYDACIASLRLTVDRLPDQRQKAIQMGAHPDWVKPVTKEGGLSFRFGFGTNRRKANTKIQESSN